MVVSLEMWYVVKYTANFFYKWSNTNIILVLGGHMVFITATELFNCSMKQPRGSIPITKN